jgi:ribosome-associated heat shock protein Hsp15
MPALVAGIHVFLSGKTWMAGTSPAMTKEAGLTDRQRIDKWLWHARVVRTRSAAAALVTSGHVRLNGGRCLAASRAVKAGDVVTVALDRAVRVLKVQGFAERRGDATAARVLFEDLSPVPALLGPAQVPPGAREPGSGRPTKQERRAIDRLTGTDER